MNATLTDDDLSQALAAAAASYPVPEALELKGEIRSATTARPWQHRSRNQLLGVAAALVVFFVITIALVGGGGPGINRTSLDSEGASGNVMRDAYRGGPGGDSMAGTTGGTTGSLAGKPVAPPAGVAGPQAVPGSQTSGDAARIVQTGSISLVVDDGKVSQAMGQLRGIATRFRGYIANEQSQGIGESPTGTITLRVPVASFDRVVAEITGKGFGAKVVSSESSGKDVTAEYADTAAQIATLRAARNRYLTILNAAKTVAEILSVQQRVDEVQAQIDRLEGARRVLANQSDLATVTVTVNEKRAEVLSTERGSWSQAWHDAWNGFRTGVEGLISHSGRALLVLMVGVLGLLAARSAWHLARRRLI